MPRLDKQWQHVGTIHSACWIVRPTRGVQMTPKRALVARHRRYLLTLAVFVLLVPLGSCGDSDNERGETAIAVDGSRANLPGVPSSLDGRLAQSLKYQGMRGVVEGVVQTGGVVVADSDDDNVFTGYDFEIVALHGIPAGRAAPFAYTVGDIIQLVVPGGSTGTVSVEWEDAPKVERGQQLLIWIQTHLGDLAPFPTDESRLVVMDAGNVAKVLAEEVVFDGGQRLELSRVTSILRAHPAA